MTEIIHSDQPGKGNANQKRSIENHRNNCRGNFVSGVHRDTRLDANDPTFAAANTTAYSDYAAHGYPQTHVHAPTDVHTPGYGPSRRKIF
jgi:hypothetical protein